MAVRFQAFQWEVRLVVPTEKQSLVVATVSELIDDAFLRNTTVLRLLSEFAVEEGVTFKLNAANDFGWYMYDIPEKD